MMHGWRVPTLALVIALAGCAEAGGPDAESAADVTSSPASATAPAQATAAPPASPAKEPRSAADVGAIRGTVVDGELLPILGARVAIPALDTAAVTGDDGAFLLTNLPPGTVRIEATAEHHAGIGQDVKVAAGQVAELDILLERVAMGAYVAVYPRTGFMPFSQWTADNAISVLNLTCTECALTVRLQDPPRQYQHEFSFEPSYTTEPVQVPEVCWHLHRNTAEQPKTLLTQGHIFSGCTVDRGRQGFDESRLLPDDEMYTLYLTGADTQPAINQRVEVWFSIAHGELMPTGWSALPPE